MKQKLILPFVAALLLLPACEKTRDSLPKPVGESCPADLEAIRIPACNETFYADLADYWLSPTPTTKASSSETEYVSLESLLDRSLAETEEVDGVTLIQIPFKSNTSRQYVRLSSKIEDSTVIDSLSVISKYYLEYYSDSGYEMSMVATLLTKPEYYSTHSDFSFIDKPNFSGIIIFSDLDGTMSGLYTFENGLLLESRMLSADEIHEYDDVEYISIVVSQVDTRSEGSNSNTLEAAYCVAKAPEKVKEDEDTDDGFESALPENGFSGGGGGSGSGGGTGSGEKDLKKDRQKFATYSVKLYGSPLDKGFVIGSGQYSRGCIVNVKAIPYGGCFFDHWTGAFGKCSGDISVTVTKDISSTAYFYRYGESTVRPCVDTTANKANPLKSMAIAPCYNHAGEGSGLLGGTYGKTVRNGGSHGGIDFAAEVGTPVYAMYDGTVAKSITNQVNRVEKNKNYLYPDGYLGDRNDGGNRINIRCNVNGNNRIFSYMHLNESDPIAINPRTGFPFKEGDKVYQGELIGYTGVTGNAIKAKNPHLHLAVFTGVGTDTENPAIYINGTIPDQKDSPPEITGSKCDDLTEGNQKNVYP
ncbi:MAG: M23 family metallopeptidase [Bacteroidales bacterium]|nr:M23 family metallopeptidase [Bacteroidales bacterium]